MTLDLSNPDQLRAFIGPKMTGQAMFEKLRNIVGDKRQWYELPEHDKRVWKRAANNDN